METEVWKPVEGWESLYEVSNKGRVRALDRKYKRGDSFVTHKGRIMKQQDNNVGYKFVVLKSGNIEQKVYVHRLVATSFIFRPDGTDTVNHMDFNPSNNCVENLEWTTAYGNYRYSFDRGRFNRTDVWKLHLKETQNEVMGKAVIGESISHGTVVFYRALNDCAKDGFQPSCVSCCCNGKRKTHAGFKWSFVPPEKLAAMKEEWDAPAN